MSTRSARILKEIAERGQQFCIYLGASLYWDFYNQRAISLSRNTSEDIILSDICQAKKERERAMKYLNERGDIIQASYKVSLKRIKTILFPENPYLSPAIELEDVSKPVQVALFPQDINQQSLFPE